LAQKPLGSAKNGEKKNTAEGGERDTGVIKAKN